MSGAHLGEGQACAWWEVAPAGALRSPSLGGGCLRGRVFTVERWVCAPVHAEPGDYGTYPPSWRMRGRDSRSRRWSRTPRKGHLPRGGARPPLSGLAKAPRGHNSALVGHSVREKGPAARGEQNPTKGF